MALCKDEAITFDKRGSLLLLLLDEAEFVGFMIFSVRLCPLALGNDEEIVDEVEGVAVVVVVVVDPGVVDGVVGV